MIQHQSQGPVPISNLRRGVTTVREEMHFTGGLRAGRLGDGWAIGPVQTGTGLGVTASISEDQVITVAATLGVAPFGIDQISAIDPNLPARIWRPLFGSPTLKLQPADSWGMIASSAHQCGDLGFAKLARHISVSLRAAGMQLRNASNEHHKQLVAAVHRGQAVGHRFRNIPMADLHLAFHSLLSEMASARDYLAQMAARRVNAPAKVDALNRLTGWLRMPANADAAADPLVSALLQAVRAADGTDPWLDDIGEYRNLFLHKEPLPANERAKWLTLVAAASPFGSVHRLTMEIELRPGALQTCDALARFVDLHNRLCRLADFAATLAPFPSEPPQFVANSG